MGQLIAVITSDATEEVLVGTNAVACDCGQWACYFCSVQLDALRDQEWAEYEADLQDMGYGVNCDRCWAVDRRHCGICRACPGQEHSHACQVETAIRGWDFGKVMEV